MLKIVVALALAGSVTSASAQTRWQIKPPPNASMIPVQSMACGIPPIPPIGCKSSICVCDQTGTRCSWQFVCN